MAKRLISSLVALSVLVATPFAGGAAFAEEAWVCPAKGAYSAEICQCLETRRPG